MPNVPLISFNSGEVTPLVDARSDTEKYRSSCRILENMIPQIYGNATRRPGTKYIATAKAGTSNIRLIPFIFSADIAYMCEFGDYYVRFYYNGAPLLNGGAHVEAVTPYPAAAMQDVQFKQIGDTMWLVHKDYPPQKLTRTSVTSFSVDEISFEQGPFLIRNDILNDDDVTMAPDVSAKGDTGTLTASSAYFQAGHVGALFSITRPRVATITEVSGAGTSPAIDVDGEFSFITRGTWTGTVKIERNEGDTDWETFRTYKAEGDRNVSLTSSEDLDDVQYRITSDAGGVEADLTVNNPSVIGIVRITGVASSTIANIEVVSKIADTTATKRWAEGAWSNVQGYPASVTSFENRMVYGGSGNNSQTVWFSESDDYENFDEGANDADSFSVVLTTTNDIKWIEALESLLVGTSGDEWLITSGNLAEAITPTNVSARQQTSHGCRQLQALRVKDSVIFVDNVGRKVREMTFSDMEGRYNAPDLNALAEHITYGGINSIAYQKNPDSIFWSVLSDGTLLSMSYERDQNVVAWARHITGETTKDVATTTYYSNAITSYKLLYIADNNEVWGIPLNHTNRTVLAIDATDAVDKGGGNVGLPCTGHPFSAGQTISIYNSTNYSSSNYELSEFTTENELVITETYAAETFDGTQTVSQRIAVASGPRRATQDSDGVVYVGVDSGTNPIVKIALDGTQTNDFFEPDDGWGVGTVQTGCYALRISNDGDHLYAVFRFKQGTTDRSILYKFKLSDGSEVWNTGTGSDANGIVYDMDIDANDNVYVHNRKPNENTFKYSSSDGSPTELANTGAGLVGHFAIVVDDNMSYSSNSGVVVIGGNDTSGSSPEGLYNLAIRDLDDAAGKKIALGGVYLDGATYKTYIIGRGHVTIKDDYIYVLLTELNKLYKLDSDLNIIAEISVESTAVAVYADLWDNIVILNQDGTKEDLFYFYNTDLSYLGNVSNIDTDILSNWDSSFWAQGDILFWPGIFPLETTTTVTVEASGTVESVAVIPGANEDEVWISVLRPVNESNVRFIEQMQPRDWGDDQEDAFFVDCGLKYDGTATNTFSVAHLEGETVQILGDGAVMPEQVVINGSITIPESVSTAIIGLPYRYNLKPMRLDIMGQGGTSKGSKKTIKEVVISFVNTLNAQFGENEDSLYNITWRTEEAYGSPPDLYTGDKVVVLTHGFDPEDPILISGNDPVPCNIRAMIPRMAITGR